MRPKVAIIGVGLLGGSIALGLRKRGGFRLVGWNHRASSRKKAAKLLPVATSFEEAVKDSDIVLLCAHSSAIGEELRRIPAISKRRVLIMDVSSVKGGIVAAARNVPGIARHFVPCHPMAGKERSGPAHADADLYRGKTLFITPLRGTPRALVRKAEAFWRILGALPCKLDPERHDRVVAMTSHLPHLLASAMMALYGEKGGNPAFARAIGSGFRDFTRIAGGNPTMWRDIVEMNHKEIERALRGYKRILGSMERNLKSGKGAYWNDFFGKAKRRREKLP
ncbi:MAG TPA: prephenate dehydrogenase [bacterium]|nr:prephenate dehydrogenase [bacterium]